MKKRGKVIQGNGTIANILLNFAVLVTGKKRSTLKSKASRRGMKRSSYEDVKILLEEFMRNKYGHKEK